MANGTFQINKGINMPITFKGLKAQYIWYLAGGMVGTLALFAILYVIGINMYVCLLIALLLMACVVGGTMHLSKTYGEHGLMKKRAKQYVPTSLRSDSRLLFIKQ